MNSRRNRIQDSFEFPCNGCRMRFETKDECNQHMEKHDKHRNPPFWCRRCPERGFLSLAACQKHYRDTPGHPWRHQCPTCGECFETQDVQTEHTKDMGCFRPMPASTRAETQESQDITTTTEEEEAELQSGTPIVVDDNCGFDVGGARDQTDRHDALPWVRDQRDRSFGDETALVPYDTDRYQCPNDKCASIFDGLWQVVRHLEDGICRFPEWAAVKEQLKNKLEINGSVIITAPEATTITPAIANAPAANTVAPTTNTIEPNAEKTAPAATSGGHAHVNHQGTGHDAHHQPALQHRPAITHRDRGESHNQGQNHREANHHREAHGNHGAGGGGNSNATHRGVGNNATTHTASHGTLPNNGTQQPPQRANIIQPGAGTNAGTNTVNTGAPRNYNAPYRRRPRGLVIGSNTLHNGRLRDEL